MPSVAIHSIRLPIFNNALSRYASVVPDKLNELDKLRYDIIPAAVAKRKADGDAFLKKDEVEKLVEWKLKHGTFRPKLLQLVQSNPAELVESSTRSAFRTLSKTAGAGPSAALDSLVSPQVKADKLKGIGPATASLLLSVYEESTPFFSDEVFRWVMHGQSPSGKKGSGDGWDREIKYNVKEYKELVDGVRGLQERLGVRVPEIEMVAWVLGREKADLDAEDDEGESKEKGDEVSEDMNKSNKVQKEKKENEGNMINQKGQVGTKKTGSKKQSPEPKALKRKADDAKPPEEGLRRSSRRKTAS